MDGFYMASCRTCGMAASEIRDALYDGHLSLCPYQKLTHGQTDDIMDGFLHRGYGRNDNKTPRCVNVLALGQNHARIPLARIETVTPTSSRTATPAVCTYCTAYAVTCGHVGAGDLIDVLRDDPEWNADTIDDED